MCVCVLVFVKPIAKEKTYRRIFRTSSEMIGISPIRTRKRTQTYNISLVFDLWPVIYIRHNHINATNDMVLLLYLYVVR